MLLFALFAVLPASAGAPLKVVTWTASTTAEPSDARNFEVSNLGDGKQSTSWAEGETGAGLGSWVQADFGTAKTLTALTVWGSNWYNTEYFGHYNRPKMIIAEYADGSTEEFNTTDEQKPQVLKLKSPKQTQTVKLRIKAIYAGKGVDTGLSEVKFFDNGSEGAVPVSGARASTTAPGDVDGNYNAANAGDGIIDSMWCEGNQKSDGTLEWLEFTLGRRSSVSTLKIRNGAPSGDLFKAVNRPTAATITFSDGASESVTLKDMPFEQSITFSAHTTDKVRLTFTSVKKGEKYDDLCVTEVTVL